MATRPSNSDGPTFNFHGSVGQVQNVAQGDGHMTYNAARAVDVRAFLVQVLAEVQAGHDPTLDELGEQARRAEAQLAALQGQMADVQGMLESLWLKDATEANRTALQRFARQLPDRAGWAALKGAAGGLLGV